MPELAAPIDHLSGPGRRDVYVGLVLSVSCKRTFGPFFFPASVSIRLRLGFSGEGYNGGVNVECTDGPDETDGSGDTHGAILGSSFCLAIYSLFLFCCSRTINCI